MPDTDEAERVGVDVVVEIGAVVLAGISTNWPGVGRGATGRGGRGKGGRVDEGGRAPDGRTGLKDVSW